ncbi:MAG: L-fucose:H+ symporter permease [Verrucomicrobiales bacterium]
MPQNTSSIPGNPEPARLLPAGLVLPFIMVTSLFAMWGFANDITNPMVAAFKSILLISNFESSLVQAAFYGGYCVMALPAALFISRFAYKSGVITGLLLYSLGCFLFVPASASSSFGVFLMAYFVMTCGLSFLETTSNPYVLSMGDPRTATQRLNFAQAFNPMGSLTGMLIAREFILQRIDPADEAARTSLLASDPEAFARLQESDLSIIATPYLILGAVVFGVMIIFAFTRLPDTSDSSKKVSFGSTFGRLLSSKRYRGAVVAQAFYVGAQIMCWTFIIQYGMHELGMTPAEAQGYNMIAMIIFVTSRFVCTFLLKYIPPALLLGVLAVAGTITILGTMILPGMTGLWCLVATSACMSLMFPTIYGLGLHNLGEDAKLGSAGLIMAIGGGSLMPPLQGLIMDGEGWGILSATRLSFGMPLICFVAIAFYAWQTQRSHEPARKL